MITAEKGHLEVAKLLINSGVCVDATDKVGVRTISRQHSLSTCAKLLGLYSMLLNRVVTFLFLQFIVWDM